MFVEERLVKKKKKKERKKKKKERRKFESVMNQMNNYSSLQSRWCAGHKRKALDPGNDEPRFSDQPGRQSRQLS